MPPLMPPMSPQGAFASLQQSVSGAPPLGEMLSAGSEAAEPITNPVEVEEPWFPDDPLGPMSPGGAPPPASPPASDPASLNQDFSRRQSLKDDMIMLLQQRAKARALATDKFQRYAQASAKSGASGPVR